MSASVWPVVEMEELDLVRQLGAIMEVPQFQIPFQSLVSAKTYDVLDALQEDEGIEYNMHWCIKKGVKRPQQFWTYCETGHDNYAKLQLNAPSWSHNSRLMTYGNSLYFVEDIDNSHVKALQLNSGYQSSVVILAKNLFSPINSKQLEFKLSLESDEEEPRHPQQGDPKRVQCSIENISKNYSTDSLNSSDFMFRINFQGREKGWFKMRHILMYDGTVISKGLSDPFMFNNPRLKKIKEQQTYTTRQLKYMHIFARYVDKKEFKCKYFPHCSNISNTAHLLERASIMFPTHMK